MKKLKQLQIENFKFFTDQDNTLNIDSKNLLVWGENGSGKSSIYWAIYTLLQCSFKDADGIDAYFTDNGEKNLINIHAENGAPSSVRMVLDDDVEYKIALGDHSIVDQEEIQIGAISSDFIDYKVVSRMMDFYHKYDVTLFKIFKEELFRFIEFNTVVPFTEIKFFDTAWEKLDGRFQKDPGSKRYPNEKSTSRSNYDKLKNAFNTQLKIICGNATTRANQILLDNFKFDIEIELLFQEFNYEITDLNTTISYTEPEIFLMVRRYFGKEDVVKKPHSFLNEAKKTAIGLAIRLAILERRLLDETKLNLLAFDDLLISLDMSNREVVMDLLFNEYQTKYQMFLFTHDKQFYLMAKDKLENRPEKENWQFWEYYVDERVPQKPKPRLFANETELSIAFNHLLNNDYPAAANYLRKHCEKIIEKHLPQSCYADPEKKDSARNLPLDSVLTKSNLFLASINQAAAVNKINDIKRFVKMLLNPLSHTERGVERHKGEIKSVIKLLEELEVLLKPIRFKRILPKQTELFLTLDKSPTITFIIRIMLREDLYIYNDAGTIKLSKCLTDSLTYVKTETGQDEDTGKYEYFQNIPLEQSYNSIIAHASINIPAIADWQSLIRDDAGTTLRQMMIIQN